MNIIAVCGLLGDTIQISSVKYGLHVVQRVNLELPLADHLTETLTGSEIQDLLNHLPALLRNNIYSKAVLSPTEVSAFVDNVAQLRQMVSISHVDDDRMVESYLGYAMLAMFVVAVARAMQYVFVVTSNDDELTGHMVVAVKYVFRYFFE